MDESSASSEASRITIYSARDISAALGRSLSQGGLVVDEADLGPEFFDLQTGLAGELFQKFMNYGARLAILVRHPAAYGERFAELAYEHGSHPKVRMFAERTEAERWLDSVRPATQDQ